MNNKNKPETSSKNGWPKKNIQRSLSQRSRFNGVVCRFDLSTFGTSVCFNRKNTEGQTGCIERNWPSPWVEKKKHKWRVVWLRFPTLGGGFNGFFEIIPQIGKMMQFDEHVFFRWLDSTNDRFIFAVYQKPANQQKLEGFLQRTHFSKKIPEKKTVELS